jgi:hypothetical protein
LEVWKHICDKKLKNWPWNKEKSPLQKKQSKYPTSFKMAIRPGVHESYQHNLNFVGDSDFKIKKKPAAGGSCL